MKRACGAKTQSSPVLTLRIHARSEVRPRGLIVCSSARIVRITVWASCQAHRSWTTGHPKRIESGSIDHPSSPCSVTPDCTPVRSTLRCPLCISSLILRHPCRPNLGRELKTHPGFPEQVDHWTRQTAAAGLLMPVACSRRSRGEGGWCCSPSASSSTRQRPL